MRNLETIKEALEKAKTTEENLKITNELLLDIREMFFAMFAHVPTSDVKLVEEKDESEFIANLPLTTRAKKVLISCRVIRLNQLKGISQSDILSMRNSGQLTLKEILTVAKENGIDIPPD